MNKLSAVRTITVSQHVGNVSAWLSSTPRGCNKEYR